MFWETFIGCTGCCRAVFDFLLGKVIPFVYCILQLVDNSMMRSLVQSPPAKAGSSVGGNILEEPGLVTLGILVWSATEGLLALYVDVCSFPSLDPQFSPGVCVVD